MTDTISFDESARYSRLSILRSEKVYGYGYQSPGGAAITHELARGLDLASRSGIRVLDIGCGTGGAAMWLAENYAAKVTGVDFAPAMIEICNERVAGSGQTGLTFVHGDARNVDLFSPDAFDVIWTRDCVLYVEDKPRLWGNAFRWLRSGGQLMATDFGRGGGELSADFLAYVTDCGYHLQNLDCYHRTIEEAGFSEIQSEDITPHFIELNEHDLAQLIQRRDEFLSEFEETELAHLIERWKKKIRFAEGGDLTWLSFKAKKSPL
jgi:phosphoethanolamine N-methyltransferase